MLGSILSGIGSIGSAIGNLFSTSSNNKTNLRIARETNEANRELYEKQFADQYRMWIENNEYNDPSKQVARFRNAGLNPLLQNYQAGQAQAMSVPSAAPMQGATMEAPQFHFGDIAQNLALAAEASKTSSESQGIQMDNQFKVEMNRLGVREKIANIDILLKQKDLTDSQRGVLEQQREALVKENWLFDATRSQRVEQFSLNNDVLRSQKANLEEQMKLSASQRALNDIHTQLGNKENEWFDRKAQAGLLKLFNDIAVGKASIGLINNQSLRELFAAQGLIISNDQAEKIKPFIVKQAKYLPGLTEQEFKSMKLHTRQQGSDYWNPFRYVGTLLGGSGAQFVKQFSK